MRRVSEPEALRARGLDAPFAEIAFDFILHAAATSLPDTVVHREHAKAA